MGGVPVSVVSGIGGIMGLTKCSCSSKRLLKRNNFDLAYGNYNKDYGRKVILNLEFNRAKWGNGLARKPNQVAEVCYRDYRLLGLAAPTY